MDAVELLRRLVSIPSPSGLEARACEFLEDALVHVGWEKAWLDGAGNVVAIRGSGPRVILLVGHVDTVPGGPPGDVRAGEIWGRGAVDAKGPLCAMAVAGGMVEVPAGATLMFVGAVGEEEDSRGARYLLSWVGGVSAIIVGEPTGTDGVAISYRGRLLVDLHAFDGGGHRSCDPGPITNVILSSAMAIEAVSSMEGFSCSAMLMRGEERGHRSALVRLDARIPRGRSHHDALEEISRAVGGTVSIEVLEALEPHWVGPNDPVVRSLRGAIRELGMKPKLLSKMGTCDMNTLAPLGCPMAVYGPGDSRLDHTDQERLSLRDYLASIEVLKRGIGAIMALNVPDEARHRSDP